MKNFFNLFDFLVSFVFCHGISLQIAGQQTVGESGFDSLNALFYINQAKANSLLLKAAEQA